MHSLSRLHTSHLYRSIHNSVAPASSLLFHQPHENRTSHPPMMAVDAHHLHVSPTQLLMNRDYFMNAMENQTASGGGGQMFLSVSGNGSFIPFYNPAAATTTTTADSGVTFNNIPGAAAAVSRKRARQADATLSFLGQDVSSLIQQQMQDVDRVLAHHAAKVRVGLEERRRRFLAAVEGGIARRMRAKEEEIERMGSINWALEERVRSLAVENQIWRELAQANEAAANALRANLEQVLAAQQVGGAEEGGCGAADADDAESCCWGDNAEGRRDPSQPRRVCRSCGEREPSVLLLPCRHMCLCSACGPSVNACPVCKCSKNASVNVNIA